jgi:hypothetical protein
MKTILKTAADLNHPGTVENLSERYGTAPTTFGGDLSRLETWVDKYSGWLALLVIAAAFALRVAYAVSCYLNPDEALHFDVASTSGWFETYKASFVLAHPPLFIMVLHGFLFLGRSELIVRLPSLIGGTAALWLTFAWIRRSLGAVPALGGLGFMALSPLAISASTEVRQYGLLIFFISAALYATERMFTERSTKWAVIQGLFLLGALLTHYTALVVLASLGLYVLLRSLMDGVPRRMFVTICVFQLFLATLLGVLYFKHIRVSIPFGRGASMDYLRPYYYSKGETPLGFAWRSLSATFLHVAGLGRLSLLFMIVFSIGLAALLTGRTKAPRLMALLAVSPFVVGFVAAIFQIFPFAGSRHQTYLLPFLAVGIAAALACWPRGWAVPLLLLGVLIAPHWITHSAPDNNPRTMPIRDMTAAMQYIGQAVPRGSLLFSDFEDLQVLRYYLAQNNARVPASQLGVGLEERYGGYRVVVPRADVWVFQADQVLGQVTESARTLGVPPGEPLPIFSTAWAETSLASRLPAGGDRDIREFGTISVIKVLAQK